MRDGLPLTVPLSSTLLLSENLDIIHEREPAKIGSERLLRLKGSDLGDLLPPRYAQSPVWYFQLAPERAPHVAGLLINGTSFSSSTACLHSPWSIDVMMSIFTEDWSYGNKSAGLHIQINSGPYDPDIQTGKKTGFILIAYECDGSLSVTACYIDVDFDVGFEGLSSCTFSNPINVYSTQELQAATRLFEDERKSPDQGISNTLQLQFPLEPMPQVTFVPLPSSEQVPPTVYWAPMEPAGIGRLAKIVAFHPDRYAHDNSKWLRLTVNSYSPLCQYDMLQLAPRNQ